MQGGRRGGGIGARGRMGSRRPPPRPQPYNRNKFLQANFRFLVSDAADLRRHAADADLMLDWDDVVEVRHSLACTSMLHAKPSLLSETRRNVLGTNDLFTNSLDY